MGLVKPKKFLGQHFLKDLSIAKDIADTVDVCPDLPILEVGPGMGVLTQFIMQKNRAVKVVELDYESVTYLRENFPALEDNIIEDDFLKLNLEKLFDGKPFVLTGNYPYNISSQIFFKMLDYKDLIPCCTGMIQKRSGRTHCRRSRKQDIRHSQYPDTSLVQSRIPVHRTRTCIQSASQGEKCGHPYDTQ